MATKIPELPVPTWFAGCGNMGAAILAGMRAATIDLNWVTVVRPSGRLVEDVRVVSSFEDAGSPPNLIVLAFKPQQLDEVAEQLQPYVSFGTAIVSLLAGVEVASLRARFPDAAAIVRAMPNLPVAVRRGVVALYSEDADDQLARQLSEIFVSLGYTIWAKDEAKLAAIGSVAGAGPAYVARFVAALAKAAEAQGISPETAATLALETVFGTAWLGVSTGEDMSALAARVASPNGTTEAGLKVLDHDHVLDQLVGVAIAAARQRGAELAESARSASLEEPSRLS
jgi:pyrroline-5-carboxylate reductase